MIFDGTKHTTQTPVLSKLWSVAVEEQFYLVGALPPAYSTLIPVTGFSMSLALAYLSFRFFESPFLKLKTRFSVIAATPKKIPLENQGEQNN